MSRLISDSALAAVTVWQEARGEDYPTKVCVAEVIRNRVTRHWGGGTTVADVVLERAQFSGMSEGTRWRGDSFEIDDADPIVRDCQRAWTEASVLGSARTGGATMFLNEILTKTLNGGRLPAWFSEGRVTIRSGQLTFLK